jgi:Ca2+-binding EF-hand superfamily protein
VGTALYGLRSLPPSPEVLALVKALTTKVRASGEMSALSVSEAVRGLQSLGQPYGERESGIAPEVLELIGALTPKVEECQEKFQAKHVGSALLGLRSLPDSYPEVRALVAALTSKLEQCTEDLNAQAVSNALNGLQTLADNSEEVRALVGALAPKVAACSTKFTAQTVANALYGLRSLKSSEEANALIAALTPLVARSKPLNSRAVVQALEGLHQQKGTPEVMQMVATLAKKIRDPRCGDLDAFNLKTALTGFPGGLKEALGDTPEVASLFRAIKERVAAQAEKYEAKTGFVDLVSAKDGSAVDGDTLRGKTEAVFRDIDTDGSGTIDLDELKSAVEKFGLELSDEAIGSMMSEADSDENGSIDVDEFHGLMEMHLARTGLVDLVSAKDDSAADGDTLRDKTDAVFRDIDTDGSGSVDFDELKYAMWKSGLKLSDQAIESLMTEADGDENEVMDEAEFYELMRKAVEARKGQLILSLKLLQ